MDIQQLKYFRAVARFKNFTRAAEACLIAQPSLSMQIKKLENELGSPLFHRQGRSIILTVAGECLLKNAERILTMHKNTLEELKETIQSGGITHFGAILSIAPYLIPSLIQQTEAGNIPPFEFEENFTEVLIKKLLNGELDFAIMSTPVEADNLLVKVIAKEPFVLVTSKSHKLANASDIEFTDISKESYLPLSSIHCAGQQIKEICRFNKLSTQSKFKSAQINTILNLVKQNQGVTVLPKMAVSMMNQEELVCQPIQDNKFTREISLVQHPDRYLNNNAKETIKLIEKTLNQFVGD